MSAQGPATDAVAEPGRSGDGDGAGPPASGRGRMPFGRWVAEYGWRHGVAIFLLAVELGNVFPALGLDSRLLLYLLYLGTALSVNTWLMKGFFDTLPKDMDESAQIDGASHVQIFFRIILPLVTPILAVVFLLTVIGTFNDFILASIILQDEENFTLAVGLTRFISGQYGARWGPFAAGAIVGALPVIAVFMWLQKSSSRT